MKYKLTDETKIITISDSERTLHRIEALEDFGNVKAGEKGGWIESEENLSQDGTAWVYDNAHVYGDARVFDNALVYGDARISGDALVCGRAQE